MSTATSPNSEITILYVDDDPGMHEAWLPVIRSRWGPASRAVRSYEAGRRLLESGDFRPSLVIHDCTILMQDQDERASPDAGAMLYAFMVGERIPIAVISGLDEERMMHEEPYRSNPPICWLSKPANEQVFAEVAEHYQRWANKQSAAGGSS